MVLGNQFPGVGWQGRGGLHRKAGELLPMLPEAASRVLGSLQRSCL